jgi:hypothetical protein
MAKEKRSKVEIRAYEIWDREGRPDGKALEHWHQAVAEIAREEAEAEAAKPKKAGGPKKAAKDKPAAPAKKAASASAAKKPSGGQRGKASSATKTDAAKKPKKTTK